MKLKKKLRLIEKTVYQLCRNVLGVLVQNAPVITKCEAHYKITKCVRTVAHLKENENVC